MPLSIDTAPMLADRPRPRASRDMQVPVSFGSCFGWLHWPHEPADVAVVFCTGIGREASSAHRSLRALADAAAASRYPALRFDYPGTGDSLDPATPDRWQPWIDAIREAARAVRRWTSARRVVLVGFRLGGLLAAVAAESCPDIAGLVLLEPIVRGRSVLTQMKIEGRLRPSDEQTPDGGLTVNETRLTANDIIALGAADLRGLKPSCPVAVFRDTTSAALASCLDEWRKDGVDVDRRDLGPLDILLRPSHQADEMIDPEPLLEWLIARVPGVPVTDRHLRFGPTPCLRPPGGLETPVRFGENNRLAGILCQPDRAHSDRVVVIVNPGGDPHHGFARFSVQFARRLARSGVASFRFDFGGLGDSASPTIEGIETPTHVFTVERTAEIGAALDVLELFGFGRFSLHGLCSGAYHALRGAVADTRIDELLLVNLPALRMEIDRPGPGSKARRMMQSLASRGSRTLLLYAADDPGLVPISRHFERDDLGVLHVPGCEVEILDGIDHDLTGDAMRRLAAGRMMDFMRAGVASTGSPPDLTREWTECR